MRYLYLLILLLYFNFGFCQEFHLPVYSQYLSEDNFVLSPLFAGIGDDFRIRANGLTQWAGVKSAPKTETLYLDYRIMNQSGIGLSFYNDTNGSSFQKGAKFSFAHHIILDNATKQYLSFGFSFSMNSFEIDINHFNLPFDIPLSDPSIINTKSNSTYSFDSGFLYRNNSYYISLTKSNFFGKTSNNKLVYAPWKKLNLQLFSGYVFKNKFNNNVEIEPSVYFQVFDRNIGSTTDFNIKYRMYNSNNEYYWAGFSYHFLNDKLTSPLNIGPMMGFKKDYFYFGYSYQFTLSKIINSNLSTHSITLGFDFFQGKSNCTCTNNTFLD